MFGGLFKRGKSQPIDEAQYEVIKQLVSNLPNEPGWAATYEKEIGKELIKRLEAEGLILARHKHTSGAVYYKISQQPIK